MKYLLFSFFLMFSSLLHAAIQEKNVEYTANDTALKGYLAWDDAKGVKQPGVIVVHEWWGLNDYARKRARMLAELGYTALAVDMYGDGETSEHPNEASAFMRSVMEHAGIAEQRFRAGMDFLRQQASVDAENIAAIGYCFGGAVVLDMARLGLPLKAAASFHGNLQTKTPAQSGKVLAEVLVLNGGADSFVTQDSIKAFETEMKQAGASYQLINYPGALHGFTNPDADQIGKANNIPLAYNAQADAESWQAMRDLFNRVFKQ
ncbi:MAG: dienelactone hydrolase family protein [Methylomonas sp.]|jgi:dienelactone hydrolase